MSPRAGLAVRCWRRMLLNMCRSGSKKDLKSRMFYQPFPQERTFSRADGCVAHAKNARSNQESYDVRG
jgi:hypothetical protein